MFSLRDVFAIRKGRTGGRALANRLGCQRLEDRTVPAVASFNSGALVVDLRQDYGDVGMQLRVVQGKVAVFIERPGPYDGFTPIAGAPAGGVWPSQVGSIVVYGSDRGEALDLRVVASRNGFQNLDGDVTVYGGAGYDALLGTEYADELRGGTGDDIVKGFDGNDDLYGGQGDDVIFGGAHNDRGHGGGGRDEFYGGSGRDFFEGQAGTDFFFDRESNEVFIQD